VTTATQEETGTAFENAQSSSTEKDPQDEGLFDATRYESPELRLPKIDGEHGVDVIELAWSGTIRLDRSDPADVNLFRKLNLGHDVDLKVTAAVAAKTQRSVTDEDGYVTDYVAGAKLKVHSVERPVGEE
jgi:hypothetical protein